MRVLLIGEYSNVHATLAAGLRSIGHEVAVASGGDFWKNYPRDIDLARKPGKAGGLRLLFQLWKNRKQFMGYDVVQLINPIFVDLKSQWCRRLYRWLRRHNKRIVLGAFGMDYYWVSENRTRMPLRYSDFNFGSTLRNNPEALHEVADWIDTDKGRLNQEIAADCDGIVAGLYEYWVTYKPLFPAKTTFIPFPIVEKPGAAPRQRANGEKLRLFIGLSKARSAYKGTDIMLQAAQEVQRRHPQAVELRVVEGVPFAQYQQLMNASDCILDQLYSYTPAMNALEAMSRGIICVGGGEEEHYALLSENDLRPIINVEPNLQSVEAQLEWLVAHPEQIAILQQQSLDYIARHHNHQQVAQQYVDFWERIK